MEQRSSLLATLARDLNFLKDTDRFKRKRGLDAIARELYAEVSAGRCSAPT